VGLELFFGDKTGRPPHFFRSLSSWAHWQSQWHAIEFGEQFFVAVRPCYTGAMLRRLLNIASIVCLVLCVALMGMWVRSYYYRYSWEIRTNSRLLQFRSDRGLLTYWELHPIASQADVIAVLNDASQGKTFVSTTVDPRKHSAFNGTVLGFVLDRQPWSINASVPIWSLVVTFAGTSLLFWVPSSRRFSLRTLFIATTFLAVVLGMIAWLDGAWIGK
jgi:hypothetical protein